MSRPIEDRGMVVMLSQETTESWSSPFALPTATSVDRPRTVLVMSPYDVEAVRGHSWCSPASSSRCGLRPRIRCAMPSEHVKRRSARPRSRCRNMVAAVNAGDERVPGTLSTARKWAPGPAVEPKTAGMLRWGGTAKTAAEFGDEMCVLG